MTFHPPLPRAPVPRFAAIPIALLLLGATPGARAAGQDPASEVPTVRGQLVDQAGDALAGVELELACHVPELDAHGQTVGMRALAVPALRPTDAEGRFEVAIPAESPTRVSLWTTAEGRERAGWSWTAAPGDEPLDLGLVRLRPEAVLVGHLEDRAGELLVDGWTVHVHAKQRPRAPRADGRHRVPLDPDTGTFRVDALAPGAYEVWASHPLEGSVDVRTVNLRPGRTVELTLVNPTSPLPDELRLTLQSAGPFRYQPAPGTVLAVDAEGRRRPMRRDDSGDWVLRPVPPGLHDVVVEDPGLRPEHFVGLRPGVPMGGVVRGDAAVRVEVTGPDGRPVPGVRLGLTLERQLGPHSRTSSSLGALPLTSFPGGLLDPLPEGVLRIRVEAPGFPDQQVRVTVPAAGEVHPVPVRLAPPGRVAGRVVDPEGVPVAGVEVQASPVPRAIGPGPSDPEPPAISAASGTHLARTDPDGRFELSGLAPGAVHVRGVRTSWVRAEATVEVRPGEATQVDLTVPATCELRVRPTLPEGWDPGEGSLLVTARPDPPATWSPPVDRDPQDRTRSGEQDGTWIFAGFPAGPATVSVLWVHPRGQRLLHVEPLELAVGAPRELDLDLTRLRWTDGTLETRANGEPLRGALVTLVPAPGSTTWRHPVPHDFRNQRDVRHDVRDVLVGEYRVRVQDPRWAWEWFDPEPLVLEADAPFERTVDVPLRRCRLRVLGPDGAPLPHRVLVLGSEGQDSFGGRATTDARGRVGLSLPPGPYLFLDAVDVPDGLSVAASFLEAGTRVVVPEGDGPLDLDVRLDSKR